MNYRSKVRYSKLALGLAIALASAPAMAQNTTANIGGRVTAANEAIVSGAQVKDSGATIPGIGGMFDLSDSLILAAPLAYVVFALITP